MKNKLKIGLYCALGLILLIGFLFGAGILELEFFKFFGPKQENVRREIFENTKSRVHGVVQDLGKYYGEYQAADAKGKIAIQNLIIMRFSQFDAEKIESIPLREWFIEIRRF